MLKLYTLTLSNYIFEFALHIFANLQINWHHINYSWIHLLQQVPSKDLVSIFD